MGEIPIIFLVFVLIWVAVIVCCKSFSSEDLYLNERSRRRELIMSQQQAIRQCHIPVVQRPSDIRVTPIRVTTISRGGGNIAMDFYEIQIPSRSVHHTGNAARQQGGDMSTFSPAVASTSPPPPFSTAYVVSTPVIPMEDVPPPSYEESVRSNQKGTKDVESHI